MGETFRRYWIPALLSSELPEPDCAPVRVRLLGEDLVAYRDTSGAVGLVDAFCPHRRAPIFFGRNEEGGLRCVYHGWKFDRDGTCVDMPSEPRHPEPSRGTLFKTKVRIGAYPTYEAGGFSDSWACKNTSRRRLITSSYAHPKRTAILQKRWRRQLAPNAGGRRRFACDDHAQHEHR